MKESASQIATMTVTASTTAYKNLDDLAGGQVTATVTKASEMVNKGMSSFSSWMGWGSAPA